MRGVEEALVDHDGAADLVQPDGREVGDHAAQVLGRQRRITQAAQVDIAGELAARPQRRSLGRRRHRHRGLPAVLGPQQRQRGRRRYDLDVRGRVEQRLVTPCVDRTTRIGLDNQDRHLRLGQRGRAEELVEPRAQPFAPRGGVLGRPRQIGRPAGARLHARDRARRPRARRRVGVRRRRNGIRAAHHARIVGARRAGRARAAPARPPRAPTTERESGTSERECRAMMMDGRGGAMPGETNTMSWSRPLPRVSRGPSGRAARRGAAQRLGVWWAACAVVAVTSGVTSAGGCRRPPAPRDELVLLNEAPHPAHRSALHDQIAGTSRCRAWSRPGLISVDNAAARPEMAIWRRRSSSRTTAPTWRHLRADARFPDGRAVEAEDVRYTFDSVRDPCWAARTARPGTRSCRRSRCWGRARCAST